MYMYMYAFIYAYAYSCPEIVVLAMCSRALNDIYSWFRTRGRINFWTHGAVSYTNTMVYALYLFSAWLAIGFRIIVG